MNRNRTQHRTINCNARFQTRQDGDAPVISGYFVVFGATYEMPWGDTETVDPHAFDGQLNGDIRALIDHETRLVLGRTDAGTLSLRVDETGLYGEIQINSADSDAMNLYARVQRGDVSQCSFGFDITAEDYEQHPDGTVHWTIKAVTLYEVSVVTFPAYAATSVTARSQEETAAPDRLSRRKHDLLERIKRHA